MSHDQNRERWMKFLDGSASSVEELQMVEQIDADASLQTAVVRDMELDSLLRELNRPHGDSHRFVQSVVTQVANLPSETSRDEKRWSDPEKLPLVSTRYPVEAPPRVVPDTGAESEDHEPTGQKPDPPLNFSEAMAVSEEVPVTLAREAGRRHLRNGNDATRSNAYLWKTMVAPLAAVTLVAVVVAAYLEWKRMETSRGPERPTAMSPLDPSSSGQSLPSMESAPEFPAEVDSEIPRNETLVERVPESLPRSPEQSGTSESIARGSGTEPVPPIEPAMDDPTEQLGPVVERSQGLVAIKNVSDEVRWYRRPASRGGGQPLSLEQGVVKLEFASGATALVTSPADFAVASANRLVVVRGRVASVVPKRAVGFTVDTPTMQIVDLGTRFETEVSSSGSVGVHVLEGKVLLRPVGDSEMTQQSWTLQKGERKFSDADGKVSDWMVRFDANVFGEMTISVNGQDLPCETADKVASIFDQPIIKSMTEQSQQSATVRYRFNGEPRDFKDGPTTLKQILVDLRTLSEIANRAEDIQGAYRVKNKIYHYGDLKEQLEARRRVARVHGPRALGGQFRPREVFELTASDADRLEKLQRELIMRLAFVELGAGSRAQIPFEFDSPAPRSSPADDTADSDRNGNALESDLNGESGSNSSSGLSPDRILQEERDQLGRKLDEILLRISQEPSK